MQPAALRAAADPWTRRLAAAVMLCVALVGCTTARTTPPPVETAAMDAANAYRFGEGDQIAVRVWKNPELSVEVPVRPDGMISVPLLNDVRAAGATADELTKAIAGKLEEFISAPQVTVILMQSAKRAYVQGEVARPGPVSLATPVSVLDAITASGGFTPFADKDDIRVIRRNGDGGEVEFPFDYTAYVRGRAPGTNLLLQPGDMVVVPQ